MQHGPHDDQEELLDGNGVVIPVRKRKRASTVEITENVSEIRKNEQKQIRINELEQSLTLSPTGGHHGIRPKRIRELL